MYRTISLIFKQSKSKQGATFVTKYKANFMKSLHTSGVVPVKSNNLIHSSQKGFSTQGQVFEKLSGDRSVGSGKLNMRATLISENLNSILTFMEENSANMNDGDYAEALGLVAMKLESDVNERINIGLMEKRQALQMLKNFINSNFQKLVNGNMTSQALLSLLCQLSKRNKSRTFFIREQEDEIIKSCQHNLESNYTKMTMNSVVGILSHLGMFRGLNVNQYLRGREEEVASLGFNNTLRYLRRLTYKGVNTNVSSQLTRYLTRDFMSTLGSERLSNKTRVFAVLAKLDSDNPYVGVHVKLFNLLKEIRAQAESHDQFSILSLIEGMVYYDDATKPEALKELYEIVTMTIRHQPENIRGDFVMDFVNFASQIRNDNSLTHEHMKILFDYILTNIKTTFDNTQRTPNVKKILPVFTLMRKHKFMEKEYAVQFFDIIYPRLLFLPLEADIKSIRFVIMKILGEEYMNKIDEEIPERVKEDFGKTDLNAKNIMSVLYKASSFVKSDKLEEVFNHGVSMIESKINQSENMLFSISLIDFYVRNMQEFLPLKFKNKMSELLLAKLDVEKVSDIRNGYKTIILLTEIIIPKEKEELRSKVSAITKKLSEDVNVKKNILNNFLRLSESDTYISNASIYKNIQILRDLIKQEDFVQANDRIIEKLLSTAFNLIYNLESDSAVTIEGIQNITSFADHIHNSHPQLPISGMYGRLPKMIRVFNQFNVNCNCLALASSEYLSRSNNPVLTQDNAMLLEKVAKSDLPLEKIKEVAEMYIKLDNPDNLLDSARSPMQKISTFKVCAILNKRGVHVPDEVVKRLKNNILENIIKNSSNDSSLRLNALVNFTAMKNEILNFREDNKEFSNITKSIFQDVPFRKLTKTIENLPRNLNNGLVNRLYIEFSNKYEKDTKIDRNLLMRILDKLTLVKWTFPTFYNKVITDFEKNFKAFSPSDHADFINYFARVELNKEDVIRASATNINMKFLNEWDKFTLLNSLVRLGFTNQEWKELILEKLTQEIDFLTVMNRSNTKDRLLFLVNMWKLGDWPANHKQILENSIQLFNKYGVSKNKNVRLIANQLEDVIGYIRRAPFFSQFDQEAANFLNTIFESRKESESHAYFFKLLVEYLKSMGHSEIEIYPVDKVCEIYLPKNKTAIIFARKHTVSIINNNELNPSGQFALQTLKSQGFNTVVVNEPNVWRNVANEKDHSDIVKFLESLNVPNLVTDGNYNFSTVDGLKKPPTRERRERHGDEE